MTRLLAITLVIVPLGAFAQTPDKKMDRATARQTLEAIQADLQQGLAALPKSYGKDPAGERAGIDQAKAFLAKAQGAFTPELSEAPRTWVAVKNNIAQLKKSVIGADLAQACSAAQASIIATHKSGAPSTDSQLKAMADAVTALETNGGDGFTRVASYFKTRHQQLTRDREKLVVSAADQRAAQDAARAEAQRKAEEEMKAKQEALKAEAEAKQKEQSEAAIRQANLVRRQLDRMLENADAVIPEEALNDLVLASNRIHGFDADAARFYLAEHRRYVIENAWRGAESHDDAAARIVGLLEGNFIDSATTKGKRFKVRWNAKKDWCYAMLMKFKDYSGEETMEDFAIAATSKKTPMQRFDIVRATVGWQRVEGVCMTDKARLTATAKLDAGKRNGIRYVVVGWEREKLPLDLAVEARVLLPDVCDVEATEAMWTNPIPGTLVYYKDEPHLVASAAPAGTASVDLFNMSGLKITATKDELKSAAPEKVNFQTQFAFAGCGDGGTSADAKKYTRCLGKVDRKYAKKLKRAERKVDKARSDAAKEKAETRLGALTDKIDAERERKCTPIEKRLETRAKRGFDNVADFFAQNPVAPKLDLAAELKARNHAKPDLR